MHIYMYSDIVHIHVLTGWDHILQLFYMMVGTCFSCWIHCWSEESHQQLQLKWRRNTNKIKNERGSNWSACFIEQGWLQVTGIMINTGYYSMVATSLSFLNELDKMTTRRETERETEENKNQLHNLLIKS